MEGNAKPPAPSESAAHLYLELSLTIKLGILVGNSDIWSIESVEVWDWELPRTADGKIISIF